MAWPRDIDGNMPDKPERFTPCHRCEHWQETPTDPQWGYCHPPTSREGLWGEYTQRNEGCWS